MKDVMFLRIPRELKDFLQREATRKGISLNGMVSELLWKCKEKMENI